MRGPSPPSILLPLLLTATTAPAVVDAFGPVGLRARIVDVPPSMRGPPPRQLGRSLRAGTSDELLALFSDDGDADEGKIRSAVSALESSDSGAGDGDDGGARDPRRFEPLLGLYEVKSVLTSNPKENPVGGKWTRKDGLAQKLFRTRTTFQHLLPLEGGGGGKSGEEGAVAQAVNVVSLDALDGAGRITVVLRGDAVPLSSEELAEMNYNRTITALGDLAVRAHFDPPKIFLGRRRKGGEYSYLPLQVGPTSSVVLDTTYIDEKVRVGMGGTSGTRFVFTRTDGEEAKEYEALLDLPMRGNRRKVLTRLMGAMAGSLYLALGRSVRVDRLAELASRATNAIASAKATSAALGIIKTMKPWALIGTRIAAVIAAFLSGAAMLLILFSSGGIERDGVSLTPPNSS